MEFDKNKHLESKKFKTKDGLDHCNDLFRMFVNKDQELEMHEEVTHSFLPLEEGQESISFDIYCCEEKIEESRANYVDKMQKLGSISMDISSDAKMRTKDRPITVHMKFGATVIEVRAYHAHSKTLRTCTVKFDS